MNKRFIALKKAARKHNYIEGEAVALKKDKNKVYYIGEIRNNHVVLKNLDWNGWFEMNIKDLYKHYYLKK